MLNVIFETKYKLFTHGSIFKTVDLAAMLENQYFRFLKSQSRFSIGRAQSRAL